MNEHHERARMLIALSGPEGILAEDQTWLAAHLESCSGCREFAEKSRQTIQSLRAIPVTAGASLVSATQMRVRQRALELQRQQERFWVVAVCCAAVTICTAITTAVTWRGLAWLSQQWMGTQAPSSTPLWEGAFVVFCLAPAVLAGILMLAKGTFLASHHGSYQD